jgi:aspartyl-tRNA(Asn)/glutamyl-tRNA(Gln) amidotransferase subunit C
VERIAELARLALTPDEIDLFARQLGAILAYADQIRALDTNGVAATSHVLIQPIERDDEPRPPLTRDEALSNAPDTAREAGLFKVPRVLA